MVSRGLFSGTSATTFSSNTAMTRGMFVTVLGLLANADMSSFTDVKSDAYYMGYIEMAGVINGKNGNLFDPDGTATRAKVSAVIHRFVDLAASGDTM